jgi:hypothetical protein
MNENVKTLVFVVAAAAVAALAAVSRPSLPVARQEEQVNRPLYPDFKDPLGVTSLEIVEFDDQRGEVHPFQVAQVDTKGKTRWSIPSHDDYPADAKDQVASAAGGLMGLTVLEMPSDNQGDQREYGVIDPDPKKPPKLGETGVGTRVVMKDKDGKELLALVVGKEVPDRPGLRYVRKVNESPIFIVQAKTDKLSTKFENWIERNLLGINSFDIKRLWIRDYSVDAMNAALIQKGETTVEYNDEATPKWKLLEDKKFTADPSKTGEGQWVPVKLPADEELNAAKLDELKTALDDLKIIDVARKPAGLSADLKAAADFTNKAEAVESLARMGFFVAELAKDQVELFSNEGEIRIVMKDGVDYVLRFGQIHGSGPAEKAEKPKGDAKDAAPAEDKKSGGLSRYLLVMAEFNPDIIRKPQLDPLPEVKKDAEKSAEAKPEAKEPEVKPAEGKKSADEKESADKAPEAKAEPAEENAAAQRQQVEKENKRKQDEYEQKIADGKKHVAELNARFADWYYVISDDVYRKIHLGHDEIFQKKVKEKEQAGPKDETKGSALPAGLLDQLKKAGPGEK